MRFVALPSSTCFTFCPKSSELNVSPWLLFRGLMATNIQACKDTNSHFIMVMMTMTMMVMMMMMTMTTTTTTMMVSNQRHNLGRYCL